ncbi:O-antigen ligase family protein [Aquibium oceanicum]|uniref:O-antigen ligase-related domain-containing protein n=1 Tax=Aquibium oceanicum TaxID=1670800 RepID=A0A1L3SSK9_9HYPH|nr:O-antigen ligase family protein [Aquibium oceanicum]APH72396.1 hypothetical protein BSQ44_14285 [Aquibium oceanicum]
MNPSLPPALDRNNKLFTVAVMGGGGVIGSGISILVGGSVYANLYHAARGRISLPRDRDVLTITAAFAFFYCVQAFSSIIHYSHLKSLWPLVQYGPFLAFPLIYARVAISRRKALATATEVGFVLGAIAGFIFAAIEIFWIGASRAEGLSGNQGPFAVVNAVIYGGCIVAALRHGGAIGVTSLVAAALAAGTILMSGTRSLWPMIVVAPVLLVFLYPSEARRFFSPKRAAIAGALALVIGVFAFPLAQDRIAALLSDYDRVFVEGKLDNSLGTRLRVWETGYQLILERPLLGHGPDKADELMGGYTHFHNFLMNAWVMSGLPGVAAVLALLVTPVIVLARRRGGDLQKFGFALSLLLSTSYVASGTVGIMFGHDILDALFIYGMIVAAFLACGDDDARTPADSVSPKGGGREA